MGWAEMHCQRPSSPPSDWSQFSLVFVSARPQEGDRDLKGTSTCTSQKQVVSHTLNWGLNPCLWFPLPFEVKGNNILIWATHSQATDAKFTQHNFSPETSQLCKSVVTRLWLAMSTAKYSQWATANELHPMRAQEGDGKPLLSPLFFTFSSLFFSLQISPQTTCITRFWVFPADAHFGKKDPVFSKLTSVDNWAG